MPFTPRTISQIQQQIQNSVANNSVLSSALTSTSLVAYWILWTFIMAVCTQALEQIMLIYITEVETIIAAAVPGTAPWIQAQVLAFEYGNTVTINPNFTIGYATPNPALQVVEQCAVVVTTSGAILVKVAGAGPAPLDGSPGISGPECTALAAYLQQVLPAGEDVVLINASADTLDVTAQIFYNGQYNSTITAAVIAAINTYLANIPFNGWVKVSSLEQAILAVPGVVDVVFNNITAVGNSVTTVIISGGTESAALRYYQTYAGYITNADPTGANLTFTVAQS